MPDRRVLVILCLALLLSGCGIAGLGASPPPTAEPTRAPTGAPTATRPAAAPPTATPAPKPTATPEPPAAPDTVWVGNTDGEGVYVRRTPKMSDRVRAYPDSTPLTIIGDDVEGDGQQWKNVRTPDGLEGYVPSIYTQDTPP